MVNYQFIEQKKEDQRKMKIDLKTENPGLYAFSKYVGYTLGLGVFALIGVLIALGIYKIIKLF